MSLSVVVIGGGIIGASIAFHLQDRGATVTLLDADETTPNRASRASFAWMNARDKNPRAYHDLNRRSLDIWPRFAARLEADIKLEWGGDIRWSTTQSSAAESEARVKVLQSWGYSERSIDRAEAERLAPGVSFEGFVSGSYSEIDGHVDALRTVNALIDRGRDRGMTCRFGESVVGLQVEKGVKAVQTDADEYPCDVCVVAAGAVSARISQMAGVDLPMYDTFGATVVTTQAPPIFDGPSVMHGSKDADIPLAVRQFSDGTTILHGGRHGQVHDESFGKTDDEVDRLLVEAKKIVPALADVVISETRRARRPIPKDGLSVLGFTEDVSNLYMAVTHSGVTLAPLIGEMAAIEIEDRQRVDILDPFRPSRFQKLSR
jgi:glycine/D-amino acid oxidase-like deaminating enzyme